MLAYLKNPILVFCVVGLVVYGLITYYNKNQCSDEKKQFTTNEIYMYSFIIASLSSGILYLTTKSTNKEISDPVSDKVEALQNRPVVKNNFGETEKKQFFDVAPKHYRKSAKNSEKVLNEPFE